MGSKVIVAEKVAEWTPFYRKLEEFRRDDPYSETGKESDRSFAKRLGMSHRNIMLYREKGQNPKKNTILMIANRLELSGKSRSDFLEVALGKDLYSKPPNIDIFGQDSVTYGEAKFKGEPVSYISSALFDDTDPKIVDRSFRGIKIAHSYNFTEMMLPAGSIIIFNTNKVEPVPRTIFIFADDNGNVFPRYVIVRGRQIWLTDGLEEVGYKIGREEFTNIVIGQSVLFIFKP